VLVEAIVEVKTREVDARTQCVRPDKQPLAWLHPRLRAWLRRLATAWLADEKRVRQTAYTIPLDVIGVVLYGQGRLLRLDHREGAWRARRDASGCLSAASACAGSSDEARVFPPRGRRRSLAHPSRLLSCMEHRHKEALRRIAEAEELWRKDGNEPLPFYLEPIGGMRRVVDHPRWNKSWAMPDKISIGTCVQTWPHLGLGSLQSTPGIVAQMFPRANQSTVKSSPATLTMSPG
jgi:hypothetical protein